MRGDDFYITAFWELCSCRAFGQAMGPIPWTAIREYGHTAGLSDAMMGVFTMVIRELDEFYLSKLIDEQRDRAAREKAEAEKAKAENG